MIDSMLSLVPLIGGVCWAVAIRMISQRTPAALGWGTCFFVGLFAFGALLLMSSAQGWWWWLLACVLAGFPVLVIYAVIAERRSGIPGTTISSRPSKKALDLPAEVEFSYEDALGQWSQRRVTAYSITRNNDGHGYIQGRCHTRRATRTFRLDRVSGSILCLDTGEFFQPSELI